MNLWRPLWLYRVHGDSMLPTFRSGDVLVGSGWRQPKLGDVVVVQRLGEPVIKRAGRLSPGRIWLLGDNSAHSHDSRDYGWVRADAIEATILRKVAGGR